MKVFKKIKSVCKDPQKLLVYLAGKNMIHLSDRKYLEMTYRLVIGKELNLDDPKSFNEKLQWLKLYNRKNVYTKMVDKYEVKKIVSELIGNEYIIPTLGVWDRFEDIDFSKLPDKFVLKCTHDSGGVVICKDKNTFDVDEAKNKINKALSRNFYYAGREWPYKNVKPRIIAEEYISSGDSKDLKDYKLMCFNGKVKCSFVCSNRNSKNGLNVDFYDINWEKMPFERHYPNSKEKVQKPNNYELMVSLAEKLAKDIPFVRVDFYEVNNKVYFGELTFFPGAGFEEFTPEEWDYTLGSWLKLPEKKIEERYEK